MSDLRAQARRKFLVEQARSKFQGQQAPEARIKPEPEVSLLDRAGNAALGAIQGVTANLGDEAGGLINAGIDAVGRAFGKGDQTSTFKSDYEMYRDSVRGTNKAAQEQSVGEYGVAEIAGGLALPGGGAKTALGAAGRMGAAGAASAFGASKDTGWGLVGDTVAGGALGGALGGGSQKALNIIKAAPGKLKSLAENSALGVFNPTKTEMAKIQALPGGTEALGRLLLKKGVVGFGDSAESAAEKFKPAFRKAGKSVGRAYDAADAAVPEGMSTNELIDALGKHAEDLRRNPVDAPFADDIDTLGSRVIDTYGDNVSFKDAHQFASKLSKRAYGKGTMDPSVAESLRRDLSEAVKGRVRDTVEGAVGDKRLQKADRVYSQFKALEKPARGAVAGSQSLRTVGMREMQSGGAGATIGATAGGLLFGPAGAVAGGFAGGAAGAVASRALKTYGNSMLAVGSDKAAIAAGYLAKAAEAGEPITKIIQQAAALGIPREVIEAMGGSQ